MKKQFRGRLSFTKEELRGSIALDFAGVNIAPAARANDVNGMNRIQQQFGLFGSNNANTYYPDIAGGSDILPKPEDFINVPFRLLSATIVGAGSWKATDFTNTLMLKSSVNKLDRKPVYYDHDTDLLNWVGIVQSPKWTESFTNPDGQIVPAGIDGIISIDAKTNPKIARGVLIGSIFSNSVTVDFLWEMSHPFESEDEFERRVGSLGTDGKMIRRVATTIIDYYESSLVWLGADPFAKKIGEDGSLLHIDSSSVAFDKAPAGEVTAYQTDKRLKVDYAIDKNILLLSKANFNTVIKYDMKREVFLALCKVLGLDPATTKPEDIQLTAVESLKKADGTEPTGITPEQTATIEAFSALKGIEVVDEAATVSFDGTVAAFTVKPDTHAVVTKAHLAKLQGEAGKVTALEADKATLQSEKDALVPLADAGKEYITFKRSETERLYKLQMGAEASEDVLKLIKDAEPKVLEGLLGQYTKSAVLKFKGKCKKCDSTEFTFQSSYSPEKTDKTDTKKKEAVTFESIYESANNTSMDIRKKK